MKRKIIRYIDFTNNVKQIYTSFNKIKELECDLRTLTNQGYKIVSVDSQLPEWYFRNLKQFGNVLLCGSNDNERVIEYKTTFGEGEVIVLDLPIEDAVDEFRDLGMKIELEKKEDNSIVAVLKNWEMYK